MVTKNVKNAHYWQVDNRIKNIAGTEGVVVLSSPKAWEKFSWTRKWFVKKPKEGYFIWVQKQVDFPLTSCVSINSPGKSQDLTNLLVVEKNLNIRTNMVCNALKKNLCGTHKAKGRMILKENAILEYTHHHNWGGRDFVNPEYEFLLGKNSRLTYNYQNLFPPESLELKTTIFNEKKSSANLNFVINSKNSNAKIKDTVFLRGEDSQGIIKIRLVGRGKSRTRAESSIVAEAAGKGHLDCQGLLVDKSATISLIPELICKNPKAQITHEASIGKISEDELNYLRMRGLKEEEAVDLIVSGFLRV